MKYDTAGEPDLAILVGVNVAEAELDELAALCLTCNIKEAGRVVQNRKDVDVTYYVGKGKVDEIKNLIESAGATCVVFDVELSGSKVRNLEEVLKVPVLDRSKVILDIFAQRAQSIEGKMQVELAQLKYNLPRLAGTSGISTGLIKKDGGTYTEDIMAKMRSSVGMRGPGEKKLELDKRTIRDQITALEEKLRKVAANRDLTRRGASKSGKPRVCIASGGIYENHDISFARVIQQQQLPDCARSHFFSYFTGDKDFPCLEHFFRENIRTCLPAAFGIIVVIFKIHEILRHIFSHFNNSKNRGKLQSAGPVQNPSKNLSRILVTAFL